MSFVPGQAFSVEHINFFASNNGAIAACIECDGPWARSGSGGPFNPGVQNDNFYTSDNSLFSAFGNWTCKLQPATPATPDGCDFVDDPLDTVNFCLQDVGAANTSVNLTISDNDLSVSNTGTLCNSTAARSFLGHAPSPKTKDQDVFLFEGKQGEAVQVMLEPDGAAGHKGEIARLILREEGGEVLGAERGALPLEISATLPRAGHYRIVVAEVHKSASDAGFVGFYRLRFTSSSAATVLLEPLRSVEP